MANPKWWNEEHESTWSRVKAAMKRDWEQTKADVSSKGRDMDQDVDDTVKQMAGKQPIPQMAGKQPIPPVGARTIENDDAFSERDEDAYRYGAGARKHYGSAYPEWDDRVEGKMKEEWNDLKSGRTWDEVKGAVRRGWDRVTK
jgi:hypothetical protein